MIKPEQIPDEAVEMALKTYWDIKSMRSSIAAAINAWPWSRMTEGQVYTNFGAKVTLPLPQEKNND